MLERIKGEITFRCDDCDEAELSTGTDDFYEAKAELDREGWRTFKRGVEDEWRHRCPDCQEAHNSTRREYWKDRN